MSPARRVGSANSKTRLLIVDAAEQIMREEGHAAVSSRSVAARVEINPGLVHYYFPTLDDLYLEVFNRGAERNLDRLAAALASREPLAALWRLSSDPRGVALLGELMGAAGHREALRDHVVQLAERARRMQIEALRELLPQYDVDQEIFPPALVAATIQGLALLLAREEVLGVSTDHQVAVDAVESLIAQLEARRAGSPEQPEPPAKRARSRKPAD